MNNSRGYSATIERMETGWLLRRAIGMLIINVDSQLVVRREANAGMNRLAQPH